MQLEGDRCSVLNKVGNRNIQIKGAVIRLVWAPIILEKIQWIIVRNLIPLIKFVGDRNTASVTASDLKWDGGILLLLHICI